MTQQIKNVVLVHGAFADGSGWEPVANILKNDGYKVSVAQPPETSYAEDVKYTNSDPYPKTSSNAHIKREFCAGARRGRLRRNRLAPWEGRLPLVSGARRQL